MTEMTPTDRVPTNGQRIYESGDHALGKEFYHDPVSDKVMVRITVPGDKWFEPHYAAEAEWQPGITYRDRFPEQWAAFEAGTSQHGGTPLESVAWLDVATRTNLKALHVHSIEQLAVVQDGLLEQVGMGARTLRDRATKHVEAAEKAAGFDQQQAEIDELRAEMAAMKKAKAAPKRRPSEASARDGRGDCGACHLTPAKSPTPQRISSACPPLTPSLARPTPLRGRCGRLLNRAGRNLAQRRNAFGAGWTVLTREYVFSTVDGQDEYPLPADYIDLIDGTVWNRDTFREGRGVLTPQEWQELRSGLVGTISIAPYYRIRRSSDGSGRSFWLDPVPSRADELVIEYLSDSWVRSADGTEFRNVFTADTDTSVYDDDLLEMDLVWRLKQARGLPFAAELGEYEMERDRRIGQDAGLRTLRIARSSVRSWRWNIPESGYGT